MSGQLLQRRQAFRALECIGVLVARPDERIGGGSCTRGERTIDQGHIEIVDPEGLPGKSAGVPIGESTGEPGRSRLRRCQVFPTADEMRPEGDLRAREVAQPRVQPLVRRVDVPVVGTFEAESGNTPGAQVVASRRFHDAFGNVRAIGNLAGCRRASAHRHGSLHGPAS